MLLFLAVSPLQMLRTESYQMCDCQLTIFWHRCTALAEVSVALVRSDAEYDRQLQQTMPRLFLDVQPLASRTSSERHLPCKTSHQARRCTCSNTQRCATDMTFTERPIRPIITCRKLATLVTNAISQRVDTRCHVCAPMLGQALRAAQTGPA